MRNYAKPKRGASLRAKTQPKGQNPKSMTDLKSAFRQLFKGPGFTAVAVLTLTRGLAAHSW
jgi:hypothetical protein